MCTGSVMLCSQRSANYPKLFCEKMHTLFSILASQLKGSPVGLKKVDMHKDYQTTGNGTPMSLLVMVSEVMLRFCNIYFKQTQGHLKMKLCVSKRGAECKLLNL